MKTNEKIEQHPFNTLSKIQQLLAQLDSRYATLANRLERRYSDAADELIDEIDWVGEQIGQVKNEIKILHLDLLNWR